MALRNTGVLVSVLGISIFLAVLGCAGSSTRTRTRRWYWLNAITFGIPGILIGDEERRDNLLESGAPSSNFPNDSKVLDLVLEFVGRGEWIFIAGVSNLWKVRYLEVEVDMQTTLRAVYENVVRLEWGRAAGGLDVIDFQGEGVGRWAGSFDVIDQFIAQVMELHNSKEDLARLECHIMSNSTVCSRLPRVVHGMARRGQLSWLRRLCSDEYGFSCESDIFYAAAQAPTPEVLSWLRGEFLGDNVWSGTLKLGLMFKAATCGRIENYQWLRDEQQQADDEDLNEWHELTILAAAHGNHLPFIQWARAEGCPWGPCATTLCRLWSSLPHLQAWLHPTEDTLRWLHAQDDFPCACS